MAKKKAANPMAESLDQGGIAAPSGFNLFQFDKNYLPGSEYGVNKVFEQKANQRLQALYKTISGSAAKSGIDQQTFTEIQGLLSQDAAKFTNNDGGLKFNGQYGGDYLEKITKKANSIFNAALKGTDEKYKARRGTEIMYQTMIDQPGRKQVVFTAPPKTPTGV